MTKEKYVLIPCSGHSSLGIPRNHLWKIEEILGENVNDPKNRKKIGWIAKDNIEERFTKDEIILSGSHTLCPICFEIFKEKKVEYIEPKIARFTDE